MVLPDILASSRALRPRRLWLERSVLKTPEQLSDNGTKVRWWRPRRSSLTGWQVWSSGWRCVWLSGVNPRPIPRACRELSACLCSKALALLLPFRSCRLPPPRRKAAVCEIPLRAGEEERQRAASASWTWSITCVGSLVRATTWKWPLVLLRRR